MKNQAIKSTKTSKVWSKCTAMIVEGEMIILTSGCQALALFERQLCCEMASPHAILPAWLGLQCTGGGSCDIISGVHHIISCYQDGHDWPAVPV